MNFNFDFATAPRIIFGPGHLREIGGLAKDLGQRALVVTGSNQGRVGGLAAHLNAAEVRFHLFSVSGEPEIGTVTEAVKVAREEKCDLVISFGGGSAIDAGKAAAAMLTNHGEVMDYLEVIGRGKPLRHPPVPFVAIPTTAGTGSEVTRNAVLASPEHRVKVSLRSPLMLPRVALVDPEVTYDLPKELTASTGLDALTQLIEPYVSNRANPMTDALCVEAIPRAARALPRVVRQGTDRAARQEMCLASLFGGLALANAGLGAVHGFAAPIGGMFDAPHGAVCAALLPHVMEINLRALRQREPQSDFLARYAKLARLLTGDDSADADAGAAWVKALVHELEVPPLSTYGLSTGCVDELVVNAAKASSMKANPIALTKEELGEIVQHAL